MVKSTIIVVRENNLIHVSLKNLGVASKDNRGSWTVFCPNLKVLGFSARSEAAAFADFEKNLRIFFGIHLKDETLDTALKSLEWTKRRLQTPNFNADNSPALDLKDYELELAA